MAFTPAKLENTTGLVVGRRLRTARSLRLHIRGAMEDTLTLAGYTGNPADLTALSHEPHGPQTVPSGATAVVLNVEGPQTIEAAFFWRNDDGVAMYCRAKGIICEWLLTQRGRPRLPGEPLTPLGKDAASEGEEGEAKPATSCATVGKAPAPAVVDAIRALQQALEASATAPAAPDLSAFEGRVGNLETTVGALSTSVADLASVMKLAASTPMVRTRLELGASSHANPIVAKLARMGYVPGQETPGNVMLAAPPSIGKTFAVRQLGTSYDLYLEHGCSDDLDEVATLLGSATPDGKGGFVIVDGVLTQAVRAAAEGKTVLMLLDEVTRLGERAQEWLLSFLTGVKTEAGRVYRLRTRRATTDGMLEVIECPVAKLHLIAATNLGARTPLEAFWDRWEVLRIPFETSVIRGVARSIAMSYGMEEREADTLARHFAGAVAASRKAVAGGELRYSLSLRDVERGVQLATTMPSAPTAKDVCNWIAERVTDKCAHWSVDLGETDATASRNAILEVRRALGAI